MEAVDSHGDGLEPSFDVVPGTIVEVTAQFVTRRGSQIAASIDEKLCIGDIVFLSEAVEKCCSRIGSTAAEHVDFEQ
jgi:hypothetical protein